MKTAIFHSSVRNTFLKFCKLRSLCTLHKPPNEVVLIFQYIWQNFREEYEIFFCKNFFRTKQFSIDYLQILKFLGCRRLSPLDLIECDLPYKSSFGGHWPPPEKSYGYQDMHICQYKYASWKSRSRFIFETRDKFRTHFKFPYICHYKFKTDSEVEMFRIILLEIWSSVRGFRISNDICNVITKFTLKNKDLQERV